MVSETAIDQVNEARGEQVIPVRPEHLQQCERCPVYLAPESRPAICPQCYIGVQLKAQQAERASSAMVVLDAYIQELQARCMAQAVGWQKYGRLAAAADALVGAAQNDAYPHLTGALAELQEALRDVDEFARGEIENVVRIAGAAGANNHGG